GPLLGLPRAARCGDPVDGRSGCHLGPAPPVDQASCRNRPSGTPRPGSAIRMKLGDGARRRWELLAVLGVAAVAGRVIGWAVGPFGGSGVERVSRQSTNAGPGIPSPTLASRAPVSVEFVTKKLVWVCLLDQDGHPVIDGQNLLADQTVGPYGAEA